MVELLEQISVRLRHGKDRRITVGGTTRSQSQADGIHADRHSQDAAGAVELAGRFVEAL